MANKQQRLFVDEYLKLRKKNATLAAINAGYSAKSAQSQSSQLLMNPNVLKYLEERESELQEELRQEFVFDALEARKVMHNIMINPDAKDTDGISAAKDFLDRAGFKPVDKTQLTGKVDVVNPFAGMSTEDLKKLMSDG